MIHPPASCLPPGFASHALQLLQRVQHGRSSVELVYIPHERWPLPPGCTFHTHPTLHISVLDSSFNPPTLAHLALANSQPPSSRQHSSSSSASSEPYDARLLLLSVRNADKALKPGDATFVQRLEMMRVLSQDIYSTESPQTESEHPQSSGNVAVAIIDEPKFVRKSTVLLDFLRSRLAAAIDFSTHSETAVDNQDMPVSLPSPKLTFLLGFDTLVRLFAPKYYPSEQAMVQMLRSLLSPDRVDCRIVCAHRRSPEVDQANQHHILEIADEFIASGRIRFIDIGTNEQTFSSSEVRASVAAGDETWKGLVTGGIAGYVIANRLYAGDMKKQSIMVLGS